MNQWKTPLLIATRALPVCSHLVQFNVKNIYGAPCYEALTHRLWGIEDTIMPSGVYGGGGELET